MDDQDIRKLAERVIDEVIKASLERFASSQATFNRIEEKENIEWPPAEGFTWETGLKSLESFVTTWNVSDKWKYCIDFLGHKEGKYEYRIVWSIPTRRKPVPRATASVYFTLVPQLSESATILVFYVFEGQRLVHRPGESKFREEWLQSILDSKSVVFNSIHL
jgi:A-kinase anchor protein 14